MDNSAIVILGAVAGLQVLTTVQQLIVMRAMRRTLRPPPPVGVVVDTTPLELDTAPTLVQRVVRSLRPAARPRRRVRTHDELYPTRPRRRDDDGD